MYDHPDFGSAGPFMILVKAKRSQLCGVWRLIQQHVQVSFSHGNDIRERRHLCKLASNKAFKPKTTGVMISLFGQAIAPCLESLFS